MIDDARLAGGGIVSSMIAASMPGFVPLGEIPPRIDCNSAQTILS
jgi:hypothetical protein